MARWLESVAYIDDSNDDACDSPWYGCGEDGCCVDSEWWAPIMLPHPFMKNGLVHLLQRHMSHSYCGIPAVPYYIDFHSTDAALAYVAQLIVHNGEVNCLQCVAASFRWP